MASRATVESRRVMAEKFCDFLGCTASAVRGSWFGADGAGHGGCGGGSHGCSGGDVGGVTLWRCSAGLREVVGECEDVEGWNK